MGAEEQEVTCDATPQIAVLPKIRSVRDVTLFRRASNYRRFEATLCLNFQGPAVKTYLEDEGSKVLRNVLDDSPGDTGPRPKTLQPSAPIAVLPLEQNIGK